MMRYRNQPDCPDCREFLGGNTSLLSLVLAAMLLLALFSPNHARADDPLPDIPYILVDASDNSVLMQNRMHERWHPASLTKLMTAYVTFRAIEAGEITAGSPVIFTRNAAATPPGKMGYDAGTRLRFDMALYTLIVKSANDVAVAVAESVAGSVPAFVGRMNAEAGRLGLSNTHFSNPNGLHDREQFVSARDLVILSSAIWNEYPQYRRIFETPTITSGKESHTSYNLLLERFDGTTGMKTGFVCAAGYNIVASAERGGRRLVAVVLGASSQTDRTVIAARLFLNGFEMQGGQPMTDLPAPKDPVGPRDMRSILCTEKARQSRYDPASETAVIKSPYLHERRITARPVAITPGGIDGEPSPAWLSRELVPARVPVPTRRPDQGLVTIDGETMNNGTLRGTVPLPTRSPLSVSRTQ